MCGVTQTKTVIFQPEMTLRLKYIVFRVSNFNCSLSIFIYEYYDFVMSAFITYLVFYILTLFISGVRSESSGRGREDGTGP